MLHGLLGFACAALTTRDGQSTGEAALISGLLEDSWQDAKRRCTDPT
jgi:hypothetical protein